MLYGGKLATKTYKTFLATDSYATVRDILECFADRSVIEQEAVCRS